MFPIKRYKIQPTNHSGQYELTNQVSTDKGILLYIFIP